VDLGAGEASGEGADTLTTLENVTGSSFADDITGSSGPNTLNGAAGNDSITSRNGVADTVQCGTGTDSAVIDPSDSVAACEHVDNGVPKNTVPPKITGTPAVGKTLTCSLGSWTGSPPPTFTRQWRRNGAAIAGATAAKYVVKAADAGKSLTCTVTATNSAGHTSKTSAAVHVT
jgi:Ca2+-binding RTX toxin-like protein